MRMAICFHGLPRLHLPGAISKWQEIIKTHSADVFIHTWLDQEQSTYSAIRSAFSPKAMILESQIDFKKSDDDYPRKIFPQKVQTIFSQWYSYKRSVSLIEHGCYDVVIRGRFDVVAGHLDLDCGPCVFVPPDAFMMSHTEPYLNYHVPVYCIPDLIAVARPDVMIKYSQLYDYIDDLYFNYNIKMCSEMLLGAHLLRNRIPVAHRIGYTYIDGRS